MITSQAKATGISVPTPVPVTTVPPSVAHDGDGQLPSFPGIFRVRV